MNNKFILDACCGGRMFWFDKKHPNTIYMDIREEKEGFIKEDKKYSVKPDVLGDFRDMPFKDKRFKLICFDPPHLLNYKSGIMFKKYGSLTNDYKDYLRKAFLECLRVLEDYGIIEFKWNDQDISIKELLSLFPIRPLFGTKTNIKKNSNTYWFCFMKIPEKDAKE